MTSKHLASYILEVFSKGTRNRAYSFKEWEKKIIHACLSATGDLDKHLHTPGIDRATLQGPAFSQSDHDTCTRAFNKFVLTIPPQYPRLSQLGIKVSASPIPHVTWKEIDVAVIRAGLNREEFQTYFAGQTCITQGAYPYDVEAILERMMSGKLTGTQEYWD